MEIDDTKKKHIMFSYSWKQKGRVRHIYDIIEENFPCIPKWIDINEDTLNLDEDKLEKKITKKTKAIMPVHLFGNPCNMSKILSIAPL